MKECSRFREHLLLDVHGEALPGHDDWRQHLEKCPRCQEEREQLKAVLLRVEDSWRLPQPDSLESARVRSSILQALDRRAGGIKERVRPLRLPVSALAGVLVILLAGWLGWQHFSPPGGEMAGLESEERLLAQEKDLLEEMELLEDMDVIQRLVQILDKKEAVL